MSIVVLDGYALNPGDLSWEALQQYGTVMVYDRTAEQDTVERAQNADIVLTNKTILDADKISRLPKLKYIGVLATGYNVVDIEAARKRGIVVTNIPAYSTASVAQMVFAHLFTITNRVEHYTQQIREGKWCSSPDFCYWNTPLIELCNKKIGIIGLGNIGQAVARIALALGMEVWAMSSKSDKQLSAMSIHKATLTELLSECDVVSLHCPLTPDTQHLINAETLQLMKPSCILINTGRGPLVHESDLAQALNEHKLAAYCADVLSVEPASENNPLLTAHNTYLTPHIAWATKEARTRLLHICIENIKNYINGTPKNVINP